MTDSEVTLLLHRWSSGDEAAINELMPLVYSDLRQLARFSHFDEARFVAVEKQEEWLAADQALEKLVGFDPTRTRIVELRYPYPLSKETGQWHVVGCTAR